MNFFVEYIHNKLQNDIFYIVIVNEIAITIYKISLLVLFLQNFRTRNRITLN